MKKRPLDILLFPGLAVVLIFLVLDIFGVVKVNPILKSALYILNGIFITVTSFRCRQQQKMEENEG